MALTVNVKHDLKRLEMALQAHPKEVLAAGVRAINRTLGHVRAESARELRQQYPGVKVGALKARLKLQRASRANFVGWVEFSEKRFGVYGNFGMRVLRGRRGAWGVRFTRLPWRLETVSGEPVSQEMLARAFRQRGRGGRASVFSRHTAARESHEVLVAPSLARAFVEQQVGASMVLVGRRRFPVVFRQELKFRISQRAIPQGSA